MHLHGSSTGPPGGNAAEEVPYGTPGSVTGLERLLELTDPELVKGCFDVYWIRHGGEDPVTFLSTHAQRVGYPHFKDLRYLGPEPRREGRLARAEAKPERVPEPALPRMAREPSPVLPEPPVAEPA